MSDSIAPAFVGSDLYERTVSGVFMRSVEKDAEQS